LANFRVRYLGEQNYQTVLAEQQAYTRARSPEDPDELWVVSHPPVFTLGQAGKIEHIIAAGHIPVVRSDRGGQVTYHGPGQVVVYTLLNVKRLGLGVKALVTSLESAVIACISDLGLKAERRPGAPGVYIGPRKIAALGLRISRGYSYHGLSFNVGMDLQPFSRINPCGHVGLEVTDLAAEGVNTTTANIEQALLTELQAKLSTGTTFKRAT